MIRYITFDDTGRSDSIARYENEEEAVGHPVYDDSGSDEQVMDTWYLSGGEVKVGDPQPSRDHHWDPENEKWVIDVDELRSRLLSEIDEAAESLRLQHLTPGNGQAMTYEEKHRQALNGGGQMITAEAEALEVTEQEVVDSVLAARAQWEQLGAQIEARRLKAKQQIRQAQTAAEMHAIIKGAFSD